MEMYIELYVPFRTLLESIEVNQYNSNFTLINGNDGTPMINSTFSIADFYAYNSSHYEKSRYRSKSF